MNDDTVKFTDADKLAAARVVEADLRTQLAAAIAAKDEFAAKARRHFDECMGIVTEATEETEQLRKSLGEMVALVQQVEAFPTIVATNMGLTEEGQAQLARAEELLSKKQA